MVLQVDGDKKPEVTGALGKAFRDVATLRKFLEQKQINVPLEGHVLLVYGAESPLRWQYHGYSLGADGMANVSPRTRFQGTIYVPDDQKITFGP